MAQVSAHIRIGGDSINGEDGYSFEGTFEVSGSTMSSGAGSTGTAGAQTACSAGQDGPIQGKDNPDEPVAQKQDAGPGESYQASAVSAGPGDGVTEARQDDEDTDPAAGDKQEPPATPAEEPDKTPDQSTVSDIGDDQVITAETGDVGQIERGNLTTTAQADIENSTIPVAEASDSQAETRP